MCEVPEFSKQKKLNWCFLSMLTLACAFSGMLIGGTMFNDTPIMHIVAQQQEWAATNQTNSTTGHPIVNATLLATQYEHYWT